MSFSAVLESASSVQPLDVHADGLSQSSFTAERLKHASPEHLHITTRRFFIGPIPEGWLNSNRKSWYKRRLELHNFSTREATFDAAIPNLHRRSSSLTTSPLLAARVALSFPQPADVHNASTSEGDPEDALEDDISTVEDSEGSDAEVETTALAPVSTMDNEETLVGAAAQHSDESRQMPTDRETAMPAIDQVMRQDTVSGKSLRAESFKTAQEVPSGSSKILSPSVESAMRRASDSAVDGELRPSTSIRTGVSSYLQADGMRNSPDDLDDSSKTALLPKGTPLPSPQLAPAASMSPRSLGQRSMTQHSPAPLGSPNTPGLWGQKAPGVRFKVAEEVADRKHRLGKRADNARIKVISKTSRRNTLREGTIMKMERMLVRIDITRQTLPDEYDENESVKTETKPIEKWREFMVVARKSKKQDEEDFRLQLYKTRVIPEIEDEQSKRKPAREIRLLAKTARVNLFSSLDKTIIIWHPYRKGTRIFIMKPSSTAHAVEWYTFIKDALGHRRPANLQVNVPHLDVTLHVERPFEILAAAVGSDAADEDTILAEAAAAEQAVAGRIISQSMKMLAGGPEWSQVLQMWSKTANMGLAWKRYDRLEWVYGVNEKRMYGSMAMQHSYDLELRPKQHYPTEAYGKKGKLHEEPAPVEGFLVRLTSQKGVHKRFGKAFFKRLYYSTHDRYLVFNRPAKATPPHPPRLATLSGSNIPSAEEIVRQTPTMFEIDPFSLEGKDLKWLKPGHGDVVQESDAEAHEEHLRTLKNLADSDGYINMCHIVKVRKLKWGAEEVDEALDSGSEVDLHIDVDNTSREDGTITEIDDDRTFELVLKNGLLVRLQAYNKETRNEWMKRMRKLVKYWKLRTTADITNLKSVRMSNLNYLNIDEEMEARIGQFARKWEVSRSEASPELYNMCRLSSCRTITMSGVLYRKPKRHATFKKCGVFLSGGQMLIYQASLRKSTGEQVAHVHQEKQETINLKECYCYSGLIVEEDLLYQNRTFDANRPGMLAATPRVYPNDGWTAADVDVMTCFVIWMNRSKGWFRSVSSTEAGAEQGTTSSKSRLRRVSQLGVPGRGMVFKCRSRAERDLWVTSISAEIEAAVERAHLTGKINGRDDPEDVRLQH